jgi:hypothetical protein
MLLGANMAYSTVTTYELFYQQFVPAQSKKFFFYQNFQTSSQCPPSHEYPNAMLPAHEAEQ